MRLRTALLILLGTVLIAGIVPAGLVMERRLGDELVENARTELEAAPMILEDRLASVTTVRMMHARDYALMPDLVRAFEVQDLDGASRLLMDATRELDERPVLVRPDGGTLLGPGPVPADLLEATRRGEMPVSIVPSSDGLHLLALAPVAGPDAWMGAVGGSTPFAAEEAASLAGLTRSEVILLDESGRVRASTADSALTALAAGAAPGSGEVRELTGTDGARILATSASFDHGRAVFVRDLDEALAILPDLQRTALLGTAGALLFALFLGIVFAHRLARPVSELAEAATNFGASREEVPLRSSALLEVRRLADAFGSMRRTLAARLSELEEANRQLEDRQTRLAALQAELVQRERMATAGRVLAQLAHEIRNPIASVRNCIEVVRRQGSLDGEAREFADMAVAELLRMHELAESMLDLHRPDTPANGTCDAAEVARETTQLLGAGTADSIEIDAPAGLLVRMPREALKQVLLNLLLNAREAAASDPAVEVVAGREDDRGLVRVEVRDRGPGISEEVADRIFDPFFTTKDSARGMGLGLYTAESLVRAAGGELRAANRSDGTGACFSVLLPAGAA